LLNLIKEYILDNYFVELYQESNAQPIPDELLESIRQTLNNQKYAKDIVEQLEAIKGIKQIIIYDSNKNVLLISDNEF